MPVFFGDSRDGDLIIDGVIFNLNSDTSGSRSYADGIAYKVQVDPLTTTISIGVAPNGFIAGDVALLINLQGTTSYYTDVGNYEIVQITGVSSDYVTILDTPTRSYNSGSFSTQKIVIQRVPQYNDIIILGGGSLTVSAWDQLVTGPTGSVGYYTGIVAAFVHGTLTIDSLSDSVTVVGKGYRGGANLSGSNTRGIAGERTRGHDTSAASNTAERPDGGGGAGYYPGSGGGGGGHGTNGTAGGDNGGAGNGGDGAIAFGDAYLNKMTYGGGGGGSGAWSDQRSSWGGGSGGGIIYIHVRYIINRGYITSTGENGVDGVQDGDGNSGGGGGGGAGGSLYLQVGYLTSNGSTILADKGPGGLRAVSASDSKDGGDGGYGIARCDYLVVNNYSYPYSSEINDVFIPDPTASGLFSVDDYYYFSGYTKLGDMPYGPRDIYVYRRDNGERIGYTTSEIGGAFTVVTTYTGAQFIVALDADAAPSYNDIVVGKITPAYYPIT